MTVILCLASSFLPELFILSRNVLPLTVVVIVQCFNFMLILNIKIPFSKMLIFSLNNLKKNRWKLHPVVRIIDWSSHSSFSVDYKAISTRFLKNSLKHYCVLNVITFWDIIIQRRMFIDSDVNANKKWCFGDKEFEKYR